MEMFRHPLRSAFHVSLLLHNLNKEAERRTGLSIVQWAVLKQLLEMPATSAQELSDAVKLHPSTLTQSLKRLVRKGLIFVSEDPRDSRKKIISLARRGKDTLDKLEGEMEQIAIRLSDIQDSLDTIEQHLSVHRKHTTA